MIGLIFLGLLTLGGMCILFAFVGLIALLVGMVVSLTVSSVIKVFLLGVVMILGSLGYMALTSKPNSWES